MANTVLDHKKVLKQFSDLIQSERDCIAMIYPNPNMESCKKKEEALNGALAKTGEEFKVLVIGSFSSGKSCMINALIGEELLPTGFLPETAVIGELHYGETKRITLYPKKGMWKDGDQPFDLKKTTPEEIAKYVSLTADDAVNSMHKDALFKESSQTRIESKFEKMVIYWPLEILRDGVVLVDSPGVNDPYSSDYIVHSYLPQADAIVYVMKSIDAYTATDVSELKAINDIGVRNITTGYTWYDAVVRQNRRNPQKLEELKEALIKHMLKHTSLGRESIHFLSSVDALEAKTDKEGKPLPPSDFDENALIDSGFKGFEEFLGHYLIESKGKDQVRNMATTMTIQCRAMIRDAQEMDKASSQDLQELKQRVERAQNDLDIIRTNSLATGNNFRIHLENYLPRAKTMISEFVTSLPNRVDLTGFQPDTKLPSGPRKLWPFGANGERHLAQEIQKECQNELERRMNVELSKWSRKELNEYLTNAITESVQTIRPNLTQIARELRDVNESVVGGTSGSGNGDLGNIALGLAYAMLTGDWFTGGMSAIYGKGAMGRAIAFQFAAGVGLGVLVLMGAPITLPVVVVTAIGASILAVLTSDNEKKIEKIKTQTVKTFRESFKQPEALGSQEETVTAVMDNVRALVDGACEDMDNALKADIKSTEDNIQQKIAACDADETTKRKQMDNRARSVKRLQSIEAEVLGICKRYDIQLTENFSMLNQ